MVYANGKMTQKWRTVKKIMIYFFKTGAFYRVVWRPREAPEQNFRKCLKINTLMLTTRPKPEIRNRKLVPSNLTTETQRTRNSLSNIIKCFASFFQTSVFSVFSVVKTADFEIEYRFFGL